MVGPHALINPQLVVENVMQCDDNWPVPAGYLLVASTTASIGDTYNPSTHVFTKAPEPQWMLDAETRGNIIGLAIQALQQLTTIINRPQPTFTTFAHVQTWARQAQGDIAYEAHVLRRLIRLAGNLLDGTD